MLKILLLANWGLGEKVLSCLGADERIKVAGVVTQFEDSNDKWTAIVKKKALRLNMPVWEVSLDFYHLLENIIFETSPDLLLSVSFHKLVPQIFLERLKFGGINLHPSRLPEFRGPSPLKWAILCGCTETGLTFHKMTSVLDGGAILASCKVMIKEDDLPFNIIERMKQNVKPLVEKLIALLEKGDVKGVQQNEGKVCYAPRIDPEDLLINWFCPVRVVYNHIRAFDRPYSGALGYVNQKLMRFNNARCVEKETVDVPGTVLSCKDNLLRIQAQDGIICAEVSNFSGGID